jgi:trimethylamine--corrinoid protein Co-methyltransferase
MVEGFGLLRAATLLMPEQIIFDNEIYHTHRNMAEGIDTTSDKLAVDVIQEVGPGRHFLAQKHTRKHVRNIWIPELTHPRLSQGDPPSPDIRKRARAKLDKILIEHEVEPLEEAVQAELRAILKAAEQESKI